MLVPQWITTCWISSAVFVFVLIQGTIAEIKQTRWHAKDILQWPMCIETRQETRSSGGAKLSSGDTKTITSDPRPSVTAIEQTASPLPSPPERPVDQELDSDSPLDNANFLSFEDWKKQNLAKAGQSAENVGGNRRAGTAGGDRRHPPAINNALDSLGDDAEIELDFGGFGANPSESAGPWGTKVLSGGDKDAAHFQPDADRDGVIDPPGQGVRHSGGPRSKDAGTTCKERFNYASFDCAATVLKTNPEAKGSSSVLIENKDSYMLNECRAQNKFLILELCDDILVDTVVLANYEFFSSIFHTFRVSVADRYPAKPDQWKELGIYEARNTREIQAFAVANPLIWARYLRIEFLTHYGNEYYCPLSLVRVHGTTMMEEYKHDGEASRVEEEIPAEAPELASGANVATQSTGLPPMDSHAVPNKLEVGPLLSDTCVNVETIVRLVLLGLGNSHTCGIEDAPPQHTASDGRLPSVPGQPLPRTATPSAGEDAVPGGGHVSLQDVRDRAPGSASVNTHSSADTSSTTVSDAAPHDATSEIDSRSSGASKDEQSTAAESTRATTTQAPPPNPTTQESFFKSVNKRLQMLETNSSLSLQYIEEQSRILRDAFNKVEKRQLSKTSTFLENLNVTVLNELRQFREQYDQVWKSVAMEFEHQRIQYHQEIYSLSAQLGVVADELVFQKRVAVIQSIVVLVCFGLMLFTRGAVSGYIEIPSVQSMVSRSYSLRSSSPFLGSPPGSPGSTEPASSYRSTAGHRRQLSDDSQDGSVSPTTAYAPPTPTSEDSPSPKTAPVRDLTPLGDSQSVPDVTPPLVRSNSSPAELNGESEGEEEESISECSADDSIQ